MTDATSPNPAPDPASRATSAGELLVIATVLFVIAVGAWWATRSTAPRLTVRETDLTASGDGPYVGAKVCARCHPGEAAAYRDSGHGQTLRLAADSALAKQLHGRSVEDPELPGVHWSYTLSDGTLKARLQGTAPGEIQEFVLQYLFGSGHHANTFITVTDPEKPEGYEHRLTHYGGADELDITPGQRAEEPVPGTTSTGRVLDPQVVLKCFGCHSTPADGPIDVAPGRAPVAAVGPLTPNVTCERCHGPGRHHVQAAESKSGSLTMAWGSGRWTANSQLGLCGQCHRHPLRFPREQIRTDNVDIARFQPIGLSQSRCFTKSEGEFTCVTCHDPHARAESDPKYYEAACLRCHAPAPDDPDRHPCPVSAKSGCVGCHMPRVDTGQKVLFTDHWIRVRKGEAPR